MASLQALTEHREILIQRVCSGAELVTEWGIVTETDVSEILYKLVSQGTSCLDNVQRRAEGARYVINFVGIYILF